MYTISKSRSVFSTLTVTRTQNIPNSWLLLNEATNRYVQRIRRTLDYCEYLKVYEIHKDKYPHIHILFIFRNLSYPNNHIRWLPTNVFQKLKSQWTLGLSDHQSPIANSDYSALKYVLKYVSKSTSSNHLWRCLLTPDSTYQSPVNELGYPIKHEKYAGYQTILVPDAQKLTYSTLKKKKIKLTSWSRGFIKAYLSTTSTQKPCPNAP